MLEGVVKFPPEFAQKYREKGYWEDRTIASHFADWFAEYADRTAIIDGDTVVTYRDLDERSTRVALNLLDLGFDAWDGFTDAERAAVNRGNAETLFPRFAS